MNADAHRRVEGAGGLVIDVWSDYVCPFCYLEMPVLARVRARFGAENVRIAWRAFELRPDPVPTLEPDGEYLRTIWAQAVYPMAAERGMVLRLPPVQPRSRKAFEATAFAHDAGRGEPMVEAIFRAFFEQGRDIGSTEVLLGIATEVGLETTALRRALDGGTHVDRVLGDEREAERLGIRGVPAMILRRHGDPLRQGQLISGAQPFETVAALASRLLAGTSRDE